MINNIARYNEGIKNTLLFNDLSKLKDKTILITGINGLICSSIVDVLNYLNENYNYSIKIIGTVRDKNKVLKRFSNCSNLEIIEQDVTKKIKINKKVDYVIHGASNSHPQKFSTDPIGTMLANFDGTKNLLQFSKKNDVKRFVLISSGEVYGTSTKDNISFTEEDCSLIGAINVRSCYPISKLAAETLSICYNNQYNIDTLIVRPCHVYGPTQQENDSRASAQFIRNALMGENIVMKSEGKQIRSYCYVIDCVTGILCSLLYGKTGQIYNIANNKSIVSIKDMALKIAKLANTKVIFNVPSEQELKSYNPVEKSVLDGSKLESIGWKPCFNFDDGIRETIEIMKNNF